MPYLEQGWQGAANTLATAQNAPKPTDFTAQFTPDQLGAFANQFSFANNNTAPQTTAGAGQNLTNSGTTAVQGALNGLGSFAPTDATGQNITNAGKYADNPYISGQVTAAMRDANQAASDVTLPGIQRNAAITGNTNSNRTQISNGIVQRGLAQQAGDISSNLRSAAYSQGLNLADSDSQNNQSAVLQALQARGSLGGAAANTGIGATSQAIGDQGNLFNIANTAAAGGQAANQADLTNQQQRYSFDTNDVYNALNNYWNIVGGQNWGGTQTGTSTATPSIYSVIGGLMGGGGSLLKGISSF